MKQNRKCLNQSVINVCAKKKSGVTLACSRASILRSSVYRDAGYLTLCLPYAEDMSALVTRRLLKSVTRYNLPL